MRKIDRLHKLLETFNGEPVRKIEIHPDKIVIITGTGEFDQLNHEEQNDYSRSKSWGYWKIDQLEGGQK